MGTRLVRAALACALTAILITAQPASGGVSLPIWENDYGWSQGDGYNGWRSLTTAADGGAYGLTAGLDQLPGVWLWPTGGREYHPGTGEWVFDAPGTTRIASVVIDVAYNEKLFAHHCLGVTLNSPSAERASSEYCKPPQGGPKHIVFNLSDPADAPLATEARLVLQMPVCNNPAERPCSKYIPELDPTVDGPFARGTRVHLVLVDDDGPTAVASGPLRDGVNGYVNGHRAYDVTLKASDSGAGIRGFGLVGPDGSDSASDAATCDPTHNTPALGSRICPPDTEATHSIDLSPLPEGAAWFHARSEDLAGNGGVEDPWRVLVDRTAPPAPHDFDVDLDGETDTANVTWVADDDPGLPDGNPGAGLSTWTYRFYHPRLGWSDWHGGTDSVEVPQSLEGDEIKVEVRSVDAVENESDLAAATLQIPLEDEEDSVEENLDDDQPEPADADVPDPDPTAAVASTDAGSQTMTLEFQALTLSERRDVALAKVRQDCSKPLVKIHCYDAVRDACHVGGACTVAKQIACSQVALYCPLADASKVSLIAQYQPTFRMDTDDRFWPVSFSTALKLRWDGRETCIVQDDDCYGRGYNTLRWLVRNMNHKVDGLHLDYPAHWDETSDQFHSTTDALGLPRINPSEDNTAEQWDDVYKSARIYWYRGGGFGTGSGTAKSLQYWTFLTFNYLESPTGVTDHHEGDVEMVAVMLDADNQPVYLFESRHGMNLKKEARRFKWNGGDFDKAFETHPVVYSAHGSHAMYESCGHHTRTSVLPDDKINCNDIDLLNFSYTRTKRISLGRSSWACWGGKLGNSSKTNYYSGGSPPDAPLWQVSTFRGDPNPCGDADPDPGTAASASVNRARARRVQGSPSGQDPLLDEFAHCDDWYQEPTQPGTTVVACDQAQLDHYVASGLTDPGPGGARLDGPDGHDDGVPAVYTSEDPDGLRHVRVTGSGAETGLYAADLATSGVRRTATFAPIALPQGVKLEVRWGNGAAELLAPGGHVLARATVVKTRGSRFPTLRTPKGLRARRVGRRVEVTWRVTRQTSYAVSAGPSRASAGARRVKFMTPARPGRLRMVLRLRKHDRWVGVRAIRGATKSRLVATRIR